MKSLLTCRSIGRLLVRFGRFVRFEWPGAERHAPSKCAKRLPSWPWRCKLLLVTALLGASLAQASAVIQEMTLHAMLKSSTSTLTTMGDYSVENPDGISNGSTLIGAGGIRWSGSFSDNGWSYAGTGTFGGMALSMNFTGTVSGNEGTDIFLNIVGSGLLGTQALQMQGLSKWLWDASNDYHDMEFSLQTKIGANSRYGWSRSTERPKCLVAGTQAGNGRIVGPLAGAPVVITGIASMGSRVAFGSGVRACANPVYNSSGDVLIAVASSGKMGGAVFGNMVKSALTPTDTAAPPFPAFNPDFLNASNVGSVVQLDGGLDGDDMDNRYRSSGRFSGDTFSGTTFDVPEPAMPTLVAMALLGAVLGTRFGRVAAGGAAWRRPA